MKTILQGWNFMRILRLVLGTAILVQGIVARDAISIILGVAFAGMAVANVGCCGTAGIVQSIPVFQKIKQRTSIMKK